SASMELIFLPLLLSPGWRRGRTPADRAAGCFKFPGEATGQSGDQVQRRPSRWWQSAIAAMIVAPHFEPQFTRPPSAPRGKLPLVGQTEGMDRSLQAPWRISPTSVWNIMAVSALFLKHQLFSFYKVRRMKHAKK